MIDFYTFGTPNGRKVSVMLEELGLPYATHVVNIRADAQFAPEFVAINPNSKIPAIVDPDGPGGKPISVFESGAILIYLAEKTGSPLLPVEPRARAEVFSWLMFQMAGVGPMCGQAHHFLHFAPEKVPYAIARYATEAKRLYGVMDRCLAEAPFLAGAYSIADIATFPWVDRHEFHEVDLADFPNVARWHAAIAARPAVARGMAVPAA
ncbi:glutathione S-transferase N-terminal domain-containing protein [Oleispirillum naphthae]|uniref:glutathione S-transferase N-terminal domain-containing protein n=1 Tax=Oleispirillum naphthae TaxID=2838853 RepID=UPI0030823F97